MPDALALYHLENFESEGSALEKRRVVKVCERITTTTSDCVVTGDAIKDGILDISE
ncbi:hypothetical protein IL306_007517 [Fusarium sp. DS 682]|nr:hypothetical protein IL306_007517 [Fusarium sp. DS 682]